jgi:hypothetical protein
MGYRQPQSSFHHLTLRELTVKLVRVRSELQYLKHDDDGSAWNREKRMALTRATEELKEMIHARPTTFVATLSRHKTDLCLLCVEVTRQ